MNINFKKISSAFISIFLLTNLILLIIFNFNTTGIIYQIIIFFIINSIIIFALLKISKKYGFTSELNIINKVINMSENPILFSKDLEVIFMNEACNKLFNIEDFTNLSLKDLFHNIDINQIKKASKEKTPSLFESDFNNDNSTFLVLPCEFILKEEQYYKLNIYPMEDFYSIFDINKDPLTLNLLDNLDCSVMMLDENRNIIYFNKSLESLLSSEIKTNFHLDDIVENLGGNDNFLKDISKGYQGIAVKSENYASIKFRNEILSLKYSISPIFFNKSLKGLSIVFNEKSEYINNLEKNALSKILQEHSDFGIYKYDKVNNLINLSQGASYLIYNEFKSKTITTNDFFNIIDKKEFIENYESKTISKEPFIEKFITHSKSSRLNFDNYFKILGIIESKDNASFIGDYGYILNITDYYIPKSNDVASAAMELIEDEVLLTDLSGTIIYSNKQASKTFNINNMNPKYYYKEHNDLNKDWWYHKLIPNISSHNSYSMILNFNNPKKFIQFKHYLLEINHKPHIYIIGRDVTEDRKFQKELRLMSNYDQLTNVLNRRGIYDNMSSMFSKDKFAVVILDLDNFKPVNDTYGHLAGDIVISTFASRLKSSAPDNSLVGRLSGDEFIVIIPEYGTLKDLEKIIGNIHTSVTNKYIISQGVCTIGASIGISIYPEIGKSRNELFRKADEAMYSVKKSGKNGFLIYSNLI